MFYTNNVYSITRAVNSPNRISVSDMASAFMLAYSPTESKKTTINLEINQPTIDENGFVCPPTTPGKTLIIAPTSLDYVRNGQTLHIGGRVQQATVLPGEDPTVFTTPDDPGASGDPSPEAITGDRKLPVGAYVSINYDWSANIGLLNFYNTAVPECPESEDILCNDALVGDFPTLQDDGRRSAVPYSCRGQHKAAQPKSDDT